LNTLLIWGYSQEVYLADDDSFNDYKQGQEETKVLDKVVRIMANLSIIKAFFFGTVCREELDYFESIAMSFERDKCTNSVIMAVF